MAYLRFAIDAGGTHTRVVTEHGNAGAPVMRLGSINPSSVGDIEAERNLRLLVRSLADTARAAQSRAVAGVVASAAVSPTTLPRWIRAVSTALYDAELTGRVLVTNDIVPLLAAPPLGGQGGVIVVGTGSGLLAGNGAGSPIRIGGCEYLGSDEGSAFAIGRDGLVAAVRALDGRAPRTAIVDRLENAHRRRADELARTLAEAAYPKQGVANLAEHVLDAWLLDRDHVAETVVERALADLGVMIQTAVSRLNSALDRWWRITGGVLTNCPPFAERLMGLIRDIAGARVQIELVADGMRCALSMASTDRTRLAGLLIGESEI